MRAPTSNAGVRNPGLMQSHNGGGSCNDEGKVSEPCPKSEIEEMIRDGVQGTADGDGLVQWYVIPVLPFPLGFPPSARFASKYKCDAI